MAVLRWFALLFVLLMPFSTVLDVAAQDTEPEDSLGYLKSAVMREFTNEGVPILEPGTIVTMVLVFDSPELASRGYSKSSASISESFPEQIMGVDSAELRPASAPKLGDERNAYAGSIEWHEQESRAGLFMWREDERIYVLYAAGDSGAMLDPLFDLASALTGKEMPASQGVLATLPGELSSGGAYDLLPSLDDMPPGWVFSVDVDILTGATTLATPAPGEGTIPRIP